MKKLIAVLIALAMVLSMSVMSFATFNGQKSPADAIKSDVDGIGGGVAYDVVWNKATGYTPLEASDALKLAYYAYAEEDITKANIYAKEDGSLMNWDEAWQAYYAFLVSNMMLDPVNVIKEVKASVDAGYVESGDAIKMIGDAAMGGIGGDGGAGDLSGVIDQIIGSIGGGQEPEISTDAYVEELKALINSGADFETITTKISDDLASGKIVASQLPDIAKALTELIDAGEIENNETVQQILEFINGLGGGEGGSFPSFGDITLPWDDGNSESGSFLDTILGIIGSIGDIFNPGTGDDPSADDPSDPGTDEPTEIPDTGDVSFVAVAAVAAVAGVALVLTRKKNDAE